MKLGVAAAAYSEVKKSWLAMADEEKLFLWRLFFAETGAEVTVIETKLVVCWEKVALMRGDDSFGRRY